MAKIAKVERNVKNKSVYFFTLPRRILSYRKIAKYYMAQLFELRNFGMNV